jgi:parvulin-like peptidyl-prolyl isomerase
LRSGATVDYVAQHFSMMDSGKVSGDTLDFAAQIHLGPKLFAAAQGMTDGQVSDPIPDKDGVHVLVMHHRVAPVPADFDSVRNNVYSDYLKAEQIRQQQANLNYLRSTAQIIIAPGFGE